MAFTVDEVVFRLTADIAPFIAKMNFAAARMVGHMAMMGTSVARTSVDMAASFERNSVALTTMVGNAEKGAKLLQELTQLAIETPFSSQELVESAKQLKAFGFETEGIINTLKVLGNVSAGTGTPMERIILAFGQVRVAGKLMGTELRQFVDGGIPIMEHLAAVMNKPKESIRGMVEQGRVGFHEVVLAFNRMNQEGGQFAGLMDKISKNTLSGRWQAFRETFDVAARNFAMAAMEGLRMKESLNSAADALQGMASNDQSRTVEVFSFIRFTLFAVAKGLQEVNNLVFGLLGGLKAWVIENQKVITTVLLIVGVFWTLRLAIWSINKALILTYAAVKATLGAILLLSGVTQVVAGFVALKETLFAILTLTNLIWASAAVGVLALVPVLGMFGAFEYMGRSLERGRDAIADMHEAFTTFLELVKSGEMQAAWNVMAAGLTYAFRVAILTIKGEFFSMLDGVAAGVSQFWEGAKELGQTAAEKVEITILKQGMAGLENSMLQSKPGDIRDQLQKAYIKDQKRLAELEDAPFARRKAMFDRINADAMRREKENKEYISQLFGTDQKLKDLKSQLGAATVEGQQTLVISQQKKWMDENANKFMTAIGQITKAYPEDVTGNQVVSDLLKRVLPDEAKVFAEAFTTQFKLGNMTIPDPSYLRKMIAQSFAQMAAPFGVSAEAREMYNVVEKDTQKGMTPFSEMSRKFRALNEMFYGSNMGQAVGGAVGGFALAKGMGGIGSNEMWRAGAVKLYQDLREKEQEKATPSAVFGTTQAMDIINSNLNKREDTQASILATLQAAKQANDEQLVQQKKIADAMEALRNGNLLKFFEMP